MRRSLSSHKDLQIQWIGTDRTSPGGKTLSDKRWLVVGANGMLGRRVVEALSQWNATYTALGHQELDVTDARAVADAVDGYDVVINTSAWTNVELAEVEPDAALSVNGSGPANLAVACAKTGARLIHVSTDYVFAGGNDCPYAEDATPGPLNVYGYSKLIGEYAVLNTLPKTGYVVRTAWLYDNNDKNFLTTMLRLAEERECLDVVADQWGHPTWARSLAWRLVSLGMLTEPPPPGVYHGVSTAVTTWYHFAQAIFELAGLDSSRVCPVPSSEYPTRALRPRCTMMHSSRWADAGLLELPHWRRMLSSAMI